MKRDADCARLGYRGGRLPAGAADDDDDPPLAVFGNTVLLPAGGPETPAKGGGDLQLVAYILR